MLKKLIMAFGLLGVMNNSFAANNLNISDSEYNYLSCFNNMLFKQPNSNQSTKNYVIELSSVLKSSQLKNVFSQQKIKQKDESGEAPDGITLVPKKSVNLLGLPISKIDVSSASWSGGMMNVKLYTPSPFAATQAALEPKYGKFSNYHSEISSSGFGLAKQFQVPNQYDLNTTETYEHSITLEKAKSGKGSVVSCKIIAAA